MTYEKNNYLYLIVQETFPYNHRKDILKIFHDQVE